MYVWQRTIPPTLKPSILFNASFGAKPPNLMTANILGHEFMVHYDHTLRIYYVTSFAEKYLDERDLTNIYIELQCASAKWFSLGLQLGLPPNNLDEIRLDRLEHPERCLLAVIHTWLKRCAKPTWRDLADALESPTVGYTALARKLQTRGR